MVLILELKTTQTPAFKSLTDTLNNLLIDVNFIFYPYNIKNSNEHNSTGGLVIKDVNKTRTVLVYTKLDADKFDSYFYGHDQNSLTLGINLENLLKCLKCMTSSDSMIWQVDSDDRHKLVIILESFERKEKKYFKLNLMDLSEESLQIDPIEYPYCITLPSLDFQKYCKDMSCATEKLELMCTKNKMTFSGTGELGQLIFEVSETCGGLTIVLSQNNQNDIVQGIFELRFLLIFIKCTNLSPVVSLFLENDAPLIVRYSIASLGEIKFVLSPSELK